MDGTILPISKPPYDLIKENSFLIFSLLKRRKGFSKKNETTTLTKCCQLFSQLYICKDHDPNIDEFFSQKNNSYPQWLSKNAVL